MSKRKELSEGERNQIIGAWKCDVPVSVIKEKLNFASTTIKDVIKYYKNTSKVKPPPRSGRKPILTERDKRHLIHVVKEDRKVPLNVLNEKFTQATSTKVSTHTLRRCLHEKGFFSRIGKRKPFVNEKNRKKRLEWTKEKVDWDPEWDYIIWSDESRFEVFGGDGRHNVWRLPKEKYDVNCLVPTFKSGRKGVMVWGCFSSAGLGPLVRINGRQTSKDYIETLDDHLIPYLEALDNQDDYLFQDDNAPIHRAKRTMDWILENNVSHISWPPQSPDLNPIENIWDELERRVRKRVPLPTNETELFNFLQDEWSKLDSSVYNNLIESMPRRIKAVIKSKGNPTLY